MNCLSCDGPLVIDPLPFALTIKIRVALVTLPNTYDERHIHRLLSEGELERALYRDRCRECVWWRIVLILGYCWI